MGKIKAQSIRCNQRTGLFDMRTEHLSQNGMQNVGGRMVQGSCSAFGTINLKGHFLAFFYFPGNYFSLVNNKSGGVFDRIVDFYFKIFTEDSTHISDLAAGLRIKRRHFSNQLDDLGCDGFGNFGTIGYDQQDL